jgi:hypothetical protein
LTFPLPNPQPKILGQLYLNRHFDQLFPRTLPATVYPRCEIEGFTRTAVEGIPQQSEAQRMLPVVPGNANLRIGGSTYPTRPPNICPHFAAWPLLSAQRRVFFALCFHKLTNCFSHKPFIFKTICVAPGVRITAFDFPLSTVDLRLRAPRLQPPTASRPITPLSTAFTSIRSLTPLSTAFTQTDPGVGEQSLPLDNPLLAFRAPLLPWIA